MPRKGENIYKRKDGRWEGRYIGCYDENHKAKYVYIYGKTYTEVKQKLAIERGRQKQHVPAEKKQITYGEVLDLWLHSTKTSIKESTYARYAHLINSHIKPQLGDYKLSMLSTEIIEDFIENQLVEGQLDRTGGLAPKTVIDLLAIVKSTIGYRDIKDDNIFVSNKGEYKIGDFGVSKILKDSSKAESLKGTPNFLAPEVYLGKEGYTKSVDLYSLGIVLYRLLNYSRNPFVPSFPAQYFSQDEDKAFEERMSGKIPPLPSLGGEEIGRVIIRAISGSNERFQIAGEFINALESAISKTSDSVLDESVKFNTASSPHSQSTVHQKQYASTIGEVLYESTIMEHSNDERNSSINKHLFESIGEAPNFDVPKVTPAAPAVQKDETDHKTKASGKQTVNSVRVVDVVPPVINEPDKTAAVDKKEIGKVVFSVPVIIFLIGVIAFFIVVPNIYGNTVSFIDWMISDPQNIIDTLRDSNVVLPKVYGIIGIKFFWWVWLACLIASLFFVGRQLHAKPEPNAANTILTKREPYLMMQDVYDALKSLKARTNDKRLDMVLYAAKRVKEKLSVESDFGYGKDIVINCENNIAKQLQFLLDIIPVADNGNIEENMKAINTAISNINSLLRKRTELKRR